MRLRSIDLTNVPPVLQFSVNDLADVIVLAGPNGVGKTRLVEALTASFRNPGNSANIRLIVDATSPSEETEWGTKSLDTADPIQATLIRKTIQRNRRRTHWESSVFQFESDRTNPQYNGYTFSWEAADPWEEFVGWEYGLNSMRNRYQDTISSLFRKVHSQRDAIAKKGLELIRGGGGHISPADFPDPISPFKKAFSQLLAPKVLLDPEPRDQAIYYQDAGGRFPLSSLSSGEREVVNIVFDFLLRDPTDSIVIFDEPELHLHPELSYKLLHALRSAGKRNQFIFVTHSPDIITASLEHTVVFISPPKGTATNQAIVVREDDATNEALRLIGQSIGIVSLGKRLVLIEGAATSLDKQTYGSILRDRFPNLVLVPSGGRGLIRSFGAVVENVLSKALWGVDFFMLCDRDAVPLGVDPVAFEASANGRVRVLKRYHLENYFLDEAILAAVFEDFEPPESWLRDPAQIRQRLMSFAQSHVGYATALAVSATYREQFGNADIMAKGTQNKSVDELTALILGENSAEHARFTATLDPTDVEKSIRSTYALYQKSFSSDDWKSLIPAKAVLEQFASAANLKSSRIKLRYLAKAQSAAQHPFQDIIEIFRQFSTA